MLNFDKPEARDASEHSDDTTSCAETSIVNYQANHLNRGSRARVMVNAAKDALQLSGSIDHLKRDLHKKKDILANSVGKAFVGGILGAVGSKDQAMDSLMIDNWVDELLRFLALKTVSGDVIKPFRLVPSKPIEAAWKCILLMPTEYTNVCKAMGNSQVIDHDPFDCEEDKRADNRFSKKRFSNTLRDYSEVFNTEAPELFWSDPYAETNSMKVYMDQASEFFGHKLPVQVNKVLQIQQKGSSSDNNNSASPETIPK